MWFVFFASMWCHTALALEPGDIAFVGFNANAPDNLAVVTFVDLQDETIYLTDREILPNGDFELSEGVMTWETGPEIIPAGSIIMLDRLQTFWPETSHGVIYEEQLGFALHQDGDNVLAYQGPDYETPRTYLAAITNSTPTLGHIEQTGLVEGLHWVDFSAGPHDDGGVYTGTRSLLVRARAYMRTVNNPEYWGTDAYDGNQFVPFSDQQFTFGRDVPALGPFGLVGLLLGLGAAGATLAGKEDEDEPS